MLSGGYSRKGLRSLKNWGERDVQLVQRHWRTTNDLGRASCLHLLLQILEGPIPPKMGQLAHLNYLDLPENHFTDGVPSELVQLWRVEVTSIQGNYVEACIFVAIKRSLVNSLDLPYSTQQSLVLETINYWIVPTGFKGSAGM